MDYIKPTIQRLDVNIQKPDLSKFKPKLPKTNNSDDSNNFNIADFASSPLGQGINESIKLANKAFTQIAGERSEFSGKEGSLAKGMNTAYDTVTEIAGKFGPWGKVAQLALNANKLVSDVVGKIGGGTDGHTKADAILGSPFFQMTPLGLINGFGGSKTDTITRNDEAFASTGAAFTGSSGLVNNAVEFSGDKFGLFSSGAKNNVNEMIAEARRQLDAISRAGQTAQNRFNLLDYMGSTANTAYNLALAGGYDQGSIRVGKDGMTIRAKEIIKGYNSRKNINNSTLNEVSVDLLPEFREGGSFEKVPNVSILNEIDVELIQEFKEGGSFNVIPEGALHAHKHHMENAENLTKKGIPVVSEKESGELEQHAEIEREEIIFRLEVTKKLEELAKENTDESAIEAGKLLVYEILDNTIDNTNKLI